MKDDSNSINLRKPDRVYRLCNYNIWTYCCDVAQYFCYIFSLGCLLLIWYWWAKVGKPVAFDDISDILYIMIMSCILSSALINALYIPLPYEGNVYIEDDLPESIYRDRIIIKNNSIRI